MIVATGAVNSGVRAGWASGENVMAWVSDMIDVVFTGVGTIILAAAGFLIYNAHMTYQIADMYAYIVLAGLVGYFINQGFVKLEEKVIHWAGR